MTCAGQKVPMVPALSGTHSVCVGTEGELIRCEQCAMFGIPPTLHFNLGHENRMTRCSNHRIRGCRVQFESPSVPVTLKLRCYHA